MGSRSAIETEVLCRVDFPNKTYESRLAVISEEASRLELNLWYQVGKGVSQKRDFGHFYVSRIHKHPYS